MALNTQTITTYKSDGLFKAAGVELQKVTESSVAINLKADISDCQDSVLALIDVPSGIPSKVILSCVGDDESGAAKRDILLENGKFNVIHLTTKGYKSADGTAKFVLSTEYAAGLTACNIKLSFLRYTPVVNH